MKNRMRMLALLLACSVVFAGCSSTPSGKVTVGGSSSEKEEESEADDKADEDDTAEADAKDNAEENNGLVTDLDAEEADEDAEDKDDDNDTGVETAAKKRELKAVDDSFATALKYIKKSGDKKLSVDYSKAEYLPQKRDAKAKKADDWEQIDGKLASDSVKKLNFLREDNTGSTMLVTAYTDPSSLLMDKIVTEEFCADGRENIEYYYVDGNLQYAYIYKTDIYGTTYKDSSLPGKKCYFKDDAMVECVLDDADVDYKNVSISAADYKEADDFMKTQYDQLEASLINKAYVIYDKVRDVPGTALITGYVGDEYGGVLSNVHMTITSKKNEFSQQFDTNGDGHFEVRVPINTADDYGVVCKYGTFTDATVDDIDIPQGTVEYSLGIIYMAEPGQNVHEPNTYLLNANYSSPKRVGKGEYCVTFTYEDPSVDLKPFSVDLSTGKTKTDAITVIKPSAKDQYKYYVTDQRGGHSGNPMTYEMSTSKAVVRVYSQDGLVASYQVPVGVAGTVWEVFEIRDGRIIPINNYFHEGAPGLFF